MMFEKKTVYQSNLVDATAAGPITVVFTSGPRPSKYQGKPPYIEFTDPTGQPRQLTIENPAIEAYLATLPQNTPLLIRATGSRDQAAVMVVGNAPAAPPPAQQPAQPYQQPAAQQPAPQNGNGYQRQDHRPESLARQYFTALETAHQLVTEYLSRHGGLYATITADTRLMMTKDVASNLFIEQNRNGGQRPLAAHAPQPEA